MHISSGQPMAPISEGNFPMGISKIGPNLFFIKARVKSPGDDRRRQERFRGNYSQAQDRYLEIKRELRGEKRPARTFGDLLEAYKESRGGVPESQSYVYKTLFKDLASKDIEGLDDTLKHYAALMRMMPTPSTGKKLSGGSVNRYRAMVAATLNLAVALGVLPKSPLSAAVWPKAKETPRDRFLDHMEVQRLLNVLEARARHLLPMVRFALRVPCRKAELVNMKRADLDLFHNAIRVHNGTTKNEDGTWKPIPPELVEYFRTLPPETDFLFFRREAGKCLPLGDFHKTWQTCLKLAGIKDFRFHDTRHIAATTLVDNGTPERAVMDIAGWRTNMLSTYYKSSSKKALGLVRFSPGSGNEGTTSKEYGESGSDLSLERAVS